MNFENIGENYKNKNFFKYFGVFGVKKCFSRFYAKSLRIFK